MKKKEFVKLTSILCLLVCLISQNGLAKDLGTVKYNIEGTVIAGGGNFAPVWFTANNYGVTSEAAKQGSLLVGMKYDIALNHQWSISTGFDIISGFHLPSDVFVHQAYFDIKWKQFIVSIGSKEYPGGPLNKNQELTSGWMVEGSNARPIPQIRLAIDDYTSIPRTHEWLSFKGHLSYGWFLDGKWQQHNAEVNKEFTSQVLYHSKSLLFRIGNKEQIRSELEFGIQTSAQFGGKRFIKQTDGNKKLVSNMPKGLKEYFRILIPKQQSTLNNVSGNYCGSWNFALNVYPGQWKIRTYYEHYFEDHSQMFWQYGRWKDGQIGLEITPVQNKWITSVVLESMSTKHQTSPILYDGVGGSFGDLQMSGDDNYYNNLEYLGWQYYGASLGHPFLHGPQYNTDGSNEFKSTRVLSNHLGVSGNPTPEWSWRVLASYVRHWGTYRRPLDKQRKQFMGLIQLNYLPRKLRGWSTSVALGIDRGNYLGNNAGLMFCIRKEGGVRL